MNALKTRSRQGFTNVYLDNVEPLHDEEETSGVETADEVAWKTAIEAAPFLLSGDAVERELPAEEVYERLQPFKEFVAEDSESGGAEDEEGPAGA